MVSGEPGEELIIKRGDRILEIGSRIIAAPMAGVLEPPYRMILHDMGLDLSFTEMVSARGTYEGSKRTMELAGWVPDKGYSGAQIFGADTRYLTYAARKMEEIGHHLIDLNTGCPKRKVMVQGSGGAMLKNPEDLLECLCAIIDSVEVPVGIKMRSGYHHYEKGPYIRLLKDIEGLGASYIAIHPRSVVQGFRGEADRKVISDASAAVDIPIIATGDVWKSSDVMEYLSRGASAVMVARALMGDPIVIERFKSFLKSQNHKEGLEQGIGRLSIARDHLERNISYFGERRGCIKFRPHLGWYLKGFKGRTDLRERIHHIENRDEAFKLLDDIERIWREELAAGH